MDEIFGQRDHVTAFDWGLPGALATAADVCVVVDVLSFSTSVTIAVERGMRVFPFAWKDERAASYAARLGGVLAVGRLEATHEGAVPAPSLSPAGLMECEPVERLVLPSPNGSTISAALQASGATVLAGCLRNASAVGHQLVRHLRDGRSVAVIAAGERWHHDDSLRPALEDQLGAGAVLSALQRLGHGVDLSPEARAAVALWDATADQLLSTLHAIVGGRELAAKGFSADVDVAGELDSSDVVAVLDHGAFTKARP